MIETNEQKLVLGAFALQIGGLMGLWLATNFWAALSVFLVVWGVNVQAAVAAQREFTRLFTPVEDVETEEELHA